MTDDLVMRLRALAVGEDHLDTIVRLTKERDALKAELADLTLELIEEGSKLALLCRDEPAARAEKAEAEAAALREAGHLFLRWFSDRESAATCNQAMQAFRVALSQPGPGAAMLERVKKLEAVAEAARDHSGCGYFPNDLRDALAALEETP